MSAARTLNTDVLRLLFHISPECRAKVPSKNRSFILKLVNLQKATVFICLLVTFDTQKLLGMRYISRQSKESFNQIVACNPSIFVVYAELMKCSQSFLDFSRPCRRILEKSQQLWNLLLYTLRQRSWDQLELSDMRISEYCNMTYKKKNMNTVKVSSWNGILNKNYTSLSSTHSLNEEKHDRCCMKLISKHWIRYR